MTGISAKIKELFVAGKNLGPENVAAIYVSGMDKDWDNLTDEELQWFEKQVSYIDFAAEMSDSYAVTRKEQAMISWTDGVTEVLKARGIPRLDIFSK